MKSTPGGAPPRYRETREVVGAVSRLIRALGERVAEGDTAELYAVLQLREVLDQALATGVAGLRQSGTTWEEIGALTKTTRQAALLYWTPRIERL